MIAFGLLARNPELRRSVVPQLAADAPFEKADVVAVNGRAAVVEGDANGFDAEYLDFWHAIRCGGTVKSSFEEGRRDMQLILAAIRAAKRS